LEKNATTIRLAKMNLAVHGLEGDIQKAITYYEDPHELLRKTDFVMANPPFNVDEIDADKVKNDPRLPFGLPGVNKKDKVSNGNYVWISYFYSYLNEQGRAGFVMSSQASSAGRDEAKVRQKLVETGDVDIMVAIRSNFFYTRTVPCELWFIDRGKPELHKGNILMIDARNIYRKVTRKIYDFSPEQEQNLLAIAWLYRGETRRYLDLVAGYCQRMLAEGAACFTMKNDTGESVEPLPDFIAALATLRGSIDPFLQTLAKNATHAEKDQPGVLALGELDNTILLFMADVEVFQKNITKEQTAWGQQKTTNGELRKAVDRLAPVAETSRDLIKQTDLLYKLAVRLIETCENECDAKGRDAWSVRDITRARKAADEARALAVEQLRQVRYFWKQAHWLTERFPEAKLCNVEGLVKLVDRAEIAANDWSLTPGRYVGVAPEEEDEDFDFEEVLRDIHVELEDLNAEAVQLAATIKKNFEELGI
ncbi:MAG: N-6 DNA methylase, partial [Clostridiaceae bacterium]|nr:N-6 DNA methylase [Clostridiaceae bacterium]